MASDVIDKSDALLEAAYDDLGFNEGDLLAAKETPGDAADQWVHKGEWLALAHSVGVDRVFFVDGNPVVVFAAADNVRDDLLSSFFNKIWCMARPQLLFLAREGELTVLDLGRPPARHDENPLAGERVLAATRAVVDVRSELRAFRRDEVESGKLFEAEGLDRSLDRADKALIRDLKHVRGQLLREGLTREQAHALIGRSLFVRYLEDREVLLDSYFQSIAQRAENRDWLEMLSAPLEGEAVTGSVKSKYLRVLSAKDFTYALFEELARDFNGDVFPLRDDEFSQVQQHHLTLLQQFLMGNTGPSNRLFFFAYKFDVIPIELISSIYEEFYNTATGKDANHGSHYTPPSLVEFVLAKVLPPERLATCPRVMDPACGSGIFLVEAFRRIVRFEIARSGGRPISRQRLREILRDQIAGIEINPEAVRVAAFSLYLAFLHYQNPRDILINKSLPYLSYDASVSDENHFGILLAANAFDIDPAVCAEHRDRFSYSCADVVVGNPPWGYPKKNDKTGREAAKVAVHWCKQHRRSIGDQELSQAFIHRAIELLRQDGCAGMLVSTGVFFKSNEKSRSFREEWLESVKLISVVNLAHVRDVFFRSGGSDSEAIAPFAVVQFQKVAPKPGDSPVQYWTAKKSPLAMRLMAVVLTLSDLRNVPQVDLVRNDRLWKVFWWGTHRDAALLSALDLNPCLEQVRVRGEILVEEIGTGFEEASGHSVSSPAFRKYKELPTRAFQRYGPLDEGKLRSVPTKVHREGVLGLYEGVRILIKRGISQRGHSNGRISARLETSP